MSGLAGVGWVAVECMVAGGQGMALAQKTGFDLGQRDLGTRFKDNMKTLVALKFQLFVYGFEIPVPYSDAALHQSTTQRA